MSYQVIARKYRPAKFADITAQEHITRTIQNALRMGRLGHGYIFSGLRGVGKTTAARVFAKALNCQRMIEDPDWLQNVTEPCGECESCRDFDSGTSLNIAEFDAASNNSVDDIRALRENVRYGPQKGRYRVYIIDEVHMLSIAAFNAFLKTLEEPPPHAIFIFATTELHKIPATIASRCQRFNFKRIPLPRIQEQLQQICDAEGIRVEPDALQLVCRKAQGSMRDAQSILDQVIAFTAEGDGEAAISYRGVADLLNYIDDEQLFQVTDAIAAGDAPKMIEVAQFVIQNGYDEQDFLEKLIEHLRNLLMVQNLRSSRLVERPEAVCERYEADARKFSAEDLMRMASFLLETQKELKFQFEYQFRFELALLRLVELHGSPAGLPEAGEASKKKARDVVTKAPEAAAVEPPAAAAPAAPAVPSPAPVPSPAQTSSPVPEPAPVPPPAPSVDPSAAPPPAPSARPSVRPAPGEGGLDLSSWQKKFTGYVSNPASSLPSVSGGGAAAARDTSAESQGEVQALRLEWNQFVDSLQKGGEPILATHLQSCEITACSAKGILEIVCCRKFSCEELLQEAELLGRKLSEFYGRTLKVRIRYDAEKDACTREKSVFDLFGELARKNEVVRYIVTEFGGELIY
ncbi:DNA polymerase III subunit gamma/tau [Chlorobium sp. N1]|uniref:DNA polymerase III subunit gamma/tau n=1 Tax=Chlorobium sp. N1 TaxID=2491138 RepID=UPI00103CC3F7|nr:DNA polymerase III subunit gamma/tau [Chlorobium sp. N1]TCD48503.1 DNA polymerase III subunit gamma/tau [Chlorobium sp. N1]